MVSEVSRHGSVYEIRHGADERGRRTLRLEENFEPSFHDRIVVTRLPKNSKGNKTEYVREHT